MNNREREARRWWRQADRDLESGRITARHDRHEVACFLSQQAAEKALKSFLYAQGEDPVLGHSLLELCRRSGSYEPELGELRVEAKRLDAVYVSTRYPNGLSGELTPGDFFDATDSEAALAASAKILAVVRNRLSEAVTSVPE